MTQVTGAVVANAAESYNATIVTNENDDDFVEQQSVCDIVATSRVYDPEGEDIFGEGYFSLQIHVSQLVTVQSVWMDMETVQSIVETGFDVVTGGQSQFRNYLHSNPVFLSVVSVKMRQGLSPVSVETMEPTIIPSIPIDDTTKNPTTFPSYLHPSLAPFMMPSIETLTLSPSTHSNQSSIPPSILVDSMVPTTLQTSLSPTAGPWTLTTTEPSSEIDLSWTGEDDKTNEPTTFEGKNLNATTTTAIVGASVAFLVFCICLAISLWYCVRQIGSKKGLENQEPHDSETNDIPEIVQLGSEQRSLADSSMGEYVTVGWRNNAKQSILEDSVPPLGSVDENSLYTSPHSQALGEEGHSSIMIMSLPTPSSLSSQAPRGEIKHQIERLGFHFANDQKVRSDIKVRAFSDRTSPNRAGIAKSAEKKNQTSLSMNSHHARSTSHNDSKSLKSDRRQYEEVKIVSIEPLDPGRNTLKENDDFTLDPSEIDVWSTVLSYDLEDSEGGPCDLSVKNLSKATTTPSSARRSAHDNNLDIPVYRDISLADSSDINAPEYSEENHRSQSVLVKPIPMLEPTKTRSPRSGFENIAPIGGAKRVTLPHPSEESTSSRPGALVTSQLAHNQSIGRHTGLPQITPVLYQDFESLSIPPMTPIGKESDGSLEHEPVTKEIYLLRHGISGFRKNAIYGKNVAESENCGTVYILGLPKASDQGANPVIKSFAGKKSRLSSAFRSSGRRKNGSDPAQNGALLERKRHITVFAPVGKLGITLANRYVDHHDVASTNISVASSLHIVFTPHEFGLKLRTFHFFHQKYLVTESAMTARELS
jgi:hypothetical protein